MAKEIERKYLLKNNSWKSLVSKSHKIQQGYLSSDPDRTVRVRILDDKGILTVKGGTGAIIEYFGEGAQNLSCTGKGTICNMGAEVGATTSTFGYDDSMERYLRATDRSDVADAANAVREHLTADPEVYAQPEKYFDHWGRPHRDWPSLRV